MQYDSVTNYFFQRSIKRKFGCEYLGKYIKNIHQASITDRIIPDEMFTTAICKLESLINIRPVTNISDDINDFECEISNQNSTLSK